MRARPFLFLAIMFLVAQGNAGVISLFKENTSLKLGTHNYWGQRTCCGFENVRSNEMDIGFGAYSFGKHLEITMAAGYPILTNMSETHSTSYDGTYGDGIMPNSGEIDTIKSYKDNHTWREFPLLSTYQRVLVNIHNILFQAGGYSYFQANRYDAADTTYFYSVSNDSLRYIGYNTSTIKDMAGCTSLYSAVFVGIGCRWRRLDFLLNGYYGYFSGIGLQVDYRIW